MVTGTVALAGAGWGIEPRVFQAPRDTIVAREPDEVPSAIRAAERAARGGSWVVGFVAYDAAPGLNSALRVSSGPPPPEPLAWFGVYGAPRPLPPLRPAATAPGPWAPSLAPEAHAGLVAAIQSRIEAGDTYQANLTFPMRAPFTGDPWELFGSMMRAQPRSFGAYLDLGGAQVLSVSPELFISFDGRRVTTRPMKGTAPRGRSSREDMSMADALLASPKEQAGNVMIVDLIRNDLGRVAVTGSVEVAALFEAERHPTVWQLTSTVTGRMRRDVDLCGLMTAMFPSGSVTGAPKVSTMGIIAHLEIGRRGVYCGAIGYLEPGGRRGRFSVAIRTGVLNEGIFSYHVGGGITYDSPAGAEYEECLVKALVVTSIPERPALVETMRHEAGNGIALLGRHLRRLEDSAGYWDIPIDPGAVADAVAGVVGGPDNSVVRLVLSADGAVTIDSKPLPIWDEPVGLVLAPVAIDAADPRWAHKLEDRSRYPSAEPGTEVLSFNGDGEVTETNLSNLIARFGDRWLTPPVSSGCLPGVYRESMLEQGVIEESPLTREDLASADEIAVTNAVRGWRKAVLIE